MNSDVAERICNYVRVRSVITTGSLAKLNNIKGMPRSDRMQRSFSAPAKLAFAGFLLYAALPCAATQVDFDSQIKPILSGHCYDCHGDGMNKGSVSLDEFKSVEDTLAAKDLWARVLKNVRAGLMPPAKKERLTGDEIQALDTFVKRTVFQIDPAKPDPGRVTIRRLNRVEYKNTIRDLMGHDFRVEDELPPDDTGYGFDNIGDVLSISPLLLEKYMQAAEVIVSSVPRVPRVVAEEAIP